MSRFPIGDIVIRDLDFVIPAIQINESLANKLIPSIRINPLAMVYLLEKNIQIEGIDFKNIDRLVYNDQYFLMEACKHAPQILEGILESRRKYWKENSQPRKNQLLLERTPAEKEMEWLFDRCIHFAKINGKHSLLPKFKVQLEEFRKEHNSPHFLNLYENKF